ncbi:MAG: antibiotic biosynthesis monooxygenase [Armatimonadetes bacterium]|nr:antibiotic biosynthesis monooxygenase [Armatimonadota bacterium]
MIIIAGKEYVAADQRDAYVASFQDFVRRTRNEPGLLDFIIAADPIEDDRVNMFELWASKEQLDDFRGRAESPEPTIEVMRQDVKKYEISSSGPPLP